MLATKYFLSNKRDFDKIKKEGKMYQTPHFGVCVLKKSKEEPSRFGVVISKKIDKLAVSRNRIKRAITESIRRNMQDIEKGYDVLFLVKKSLASETTESIMNKTQSWLKQAKF